VLKKNPEGFDLFTKEKEIEIQHVIARLANEALFTGTCLKSTDCLQMLAKIILL
jgi:hypothetical protein